MFDFITYALALKKSKAYTDQIFASFPNGLVYQGAVDYQGDLPTDATIGDVYTVKYIGFSGTSPDGREYAWGKYSGTVQWILISGITDVKAEDGQSLVKDGIATVPSALQSLPIEIKNQTFNTIQAIVSACNTAMQQGHIKLSGFYRGGINTSSMLPKKDGSFFIGNIELRMSVVANTKGDTVYIFEATSITDAPYLWTCYAGADCRTSGWIIYPTWAELSEHIDDSAYSENGAHNLRYYNDSLQYFDGSSWVAISMANLKI